MTKLRNKLVLVLLALFVVACLGVTIACGDDETPKDTSVTYTVTVTAEGAGVGGVKVTVKKGSATLGTPATTDKDGKVQFKLAADDYTVALADLPDGYELPAGATLKFDAERKLTVALAEKFAYKIKLVNPDGSAYTADGVTVGICTLEGHCLNPVAVGADGVAKVYEVEKTDYHVQVLGLPDGYAYEGYTGDVISPGYAVYKNEAGNYVLAGDENTYVSLSATKTETTVKIYPVEQIKLAEMTPLTAEQITATGLTPNGDKVYKCEVTLAAGATAYYSYTPEYDGTYYLYATEAGAYKLNNEFLLGDSYLTGGGSFFKTGHPLLGRAGETYYLNVTNTGEAEVKATFLLTTPAASKVVLENAGTVTAVVNKAGANALVALSPKAGAAYKLTLKGKGAIKQVTYEYEADRTTFADADYKDNASCTAKFTEDMVGRTLYFVVSVKADKYPAAVDVEIEKTADLKNETTDVTVGAIADFGNQTGKELVEIELDGSSSAKLVYNDTDKYYHYGTKDGPVVVVILTKVLPNERFASESPIIYMELSTDGRVSPYVVDVTPAVDKTDLTKGNKYEDYRNLLRGFKDYKVDSVTQKLSIPTDITVDKYYAKAVKNDDGAYPLTKELEKFLKAFVKDEGVSFNLPWDADDNDLWLFACYYYDAYVEPDVIVGEYNHVNVKATADEFLSEENGKLNGDEYSLVINKRGTYTIKETTFFGAEVCETGTWTKDGETYSFKTADGNTEYNVTFNAEEGYVVLMTDASTGWSFRNENSEIVEFAVGEYEFVSRKAADGTVTEVGGAVTAESYKLTVNADGSFVVYEKSGDNYDELYNEQGKWTNKKGVYTFTVPNGVWDEVKQNYADLVFAVSYDVGTGAIKLVGSDSSEWAFKKDGETFVGVYELVSFTEITDDGEETEYNIGDTYVDAWYGDEYEVTNDRFVLEIAGNTFYLNGYGITLYNCEGVWTKTNAGRITLAYKDAWGPMYLPVSYNKADATYTVIIGDEMTGYMIFVFKKKTNQTVDPIVGEYVNFVAKSENGEDLTVENGDFRSDDYKLVVKASGRFTVLKHGYPYYEAIDDEGSFGIWTKTETGYAFTYYGYDSEYNYGEISYAVTVDNDFSEIILTNESAELGWSFTKSAQNAGEADVIVGEYKFVMTTNSYGDTETIGDKYYNYFDNGTIDQDYYNLVVLKNGRFAITCLDDGKVLGFWSKEGNVYTFSKPGSRSGPPVTYAVAFDAATGRVILTGNNYEIWVFQKGGDAELTKVYATEEGDSLLQVYDDNAFKLYVGNLQAMVGTLFGGEFTVTDKAESVTTATASNDKGVYTFTVNTDKYVFDVLGETAMSLLSVDKDAKVEVTDNGVKFYYHTEGEGDQEDVDTLACVALVADFETDTLKLNYVWLQDGVDSVSVAVSMEEDEETGDDYSLITVVVCYTEGEPATFRFVAGG